MRWVNRDSSSFSGVTLTALPKADLLLADPTAANRTTFNQAAVAGNMGWAPQVVTNFDPDPSHATVLATHQTQFDKIVVTRLTWSGTTAVLGTTADLPTLLPTSSPDLHPIEQAFAKTKQALRRVGARSWESVAVAVGETLRTVTEADARAFFADAGFSLP